MSTRPFTIAMVAGMPYPMAKASVIRVNNIVRALVNRYPDIRVKIFAYQGAGPLPSHPRIDLHLVGGVDSNKATYYSWGNKLAADRKLIQALMRHRHEFDLIHCHTIEGLGISQAFKLLTRSKAPVCIDVHGPIVAELVHYRLIPNWRPVVAAVAKLEQLMLNAVQHVFVSNEGLRNLLAEQSRDVGGAPRAAGCGALRCDHLEWLSDEGAGAMAAAGTVAVLLPGAYYFLRGTRPPPIEMLRKRGVAMAVSTAASQGA